MKIAIIDGDSILYLASKDSIEESIINVNSIMNSIMKETGSSHYYLFLSKSPYFRNSISEDYKVKRTLPTLKYIKSLKGYLEEEFKAISYDKLEADDLVSFASMESSRQAIEYVICSIDKDVLKQTPGHHFNYKTYEQGYTSIDAAIEFIFIQTCMGDSTDNIKGIPKVGEVKAKEALKNLTMDQMLLKTFSLYLEYYISLGNSIFEFQKNFRLVYLLKNNEDFLREVGYVPSLPDPRTLF